MHATASAAAAAAAVQYVSASSRACSTRSTLYDVRNSSTSHDKNTKRLHVCHYSHRPALALQSASISGLSMHWEDSKTGVWCIDASQQLIASSHVIQVDTATASADRHATGLRNCEATIQKTTTRLYCWQDDRTQLAIDQPPSAAASKSLQSIYCSIFVEVKTRQEIQLLQLAEKVRDALYFFEIILATPKVVWSHIGLLSFRCLGYFVSLLTSLILNDLEQASEWDQSVTQWCKFVLLTDYRILNTAVLSVIYCSAALCVRHLETSQPISCTIQNTACYYCGRRMDEAGSS